MSRYVYTSKWFPHSPIDLQKNLLCAVRPMPQPSPNSSSKWWNPMLSIHYTGFRFLISIRNGTKIARQATDGAGAANIAAYRHKQVRWWHSGPSIPVSLSPAQLNTFGVVGAKNSPRGVKWPERHRPPWTGCHGICLVEQCEQGRARSQRYTRNVSEQVSSSVPYSIKTAHFHCSSLYKNWYENRCFSEVEAFFVIFSRIFQLIFNFSVSSTITYNLLQIAHLWWSSGL